jgi:hypothetical protein
MTNNIIKLKMLIEEYEYINRELEDMQSCWEDCGDSSCDPALQYEKEMERENAYNEIKNFMINL